MKFFSIAYKSQKLFITTPYCRQEYKTIHILLPREYKTTHCTQVNKETGANYSLQFEVQFSHLT